MMLKSKLAAFAGALLLAGSAFAGQESICPNINDIKAEGISMAEEIGPNIYISYNISNYNTESTWGFLIAPVEADSTEVAIEGANEILSTMSAPGVPEQHGGAVICDYDTGRQDVFAAAINDNQQITPMRLKYFFKRAH
ncbi:DUF4949 domain-containing protein [Legionella bononiensis]|uniref:DUF4949 domain-containing protein n=1 Tax=Legionella bononiensis TaxID=2793102 RepID=A0ABS1W736_9GAMM|nr:DUF4949 domain-containing protein [Legionella bononiensis]MBL7481259.1 DUF4949 domain-containing protein [Legionella bononiensis]MBL7525164.1 DUF4949 domain-containing protein [Legionella bononiensis]MBL7562888.1 DUF4949 domain-containing protein [Legionella bononiensis]